MARSVRAAVDRWWNGISLRAKVTGVVVVLLATGLAVAGAGTITVLNNYLLEQVDDQIEAVYAGLERPIDFGGFREFGSAAAGLTPFYIAAVDAEGHLLADNLSESQQDIRPDLSSLTLERASRLDGAITLWNESLTTQWRVMVAPLRAGPGPQQATLVIGRDLGDMTRIIARYTAIFLAFSFGVLLMSAAAAQLLVTSAFAPLRDVERTAARFAAGDYSQRLGGATPNTEVGRLNRSLNQMLARIDRAFADRARSIEQMRRFVADASHELRTPLVSLRGYAELYRMGALTTRAEVAQAMDRIEREAIRMSALVEDLLELARLDEARPLDREAVDLLPIARDAVLDASASAPSRRITLVVPEDPPASAPGAEEPAKAATASGRRRGKPDSRDAATASGVAGAARRLGATAGAFAFAGATLARLRRRRAAPSGEAETPAAPLPDVGPVVYAEEDKIRQVVTNLMGNAMRFTPDDSPIEVVVEVDRVGRYGVISIVDHGEGIPPEIREKIFQRLWRADTSRTRDTGGSGLGLAIVASIVEAHEGHVEVLETPGGGATFRVSLPLLPAPEPEPAPTPPAKPAKGRARRS